MVDDMVDGRGRSAREESPDGSGRLRLTGSLPVPADQADAEDLLWQELTSQLEWYDRQATRCRYGYQGLRLLALIVGAAVTVLAASGAPAALTASLAAVVVVAEGAQQLFQFHDNWIEYRSAAETLRHHAFMFAAKVEPYAGPARRDALASVIRDVTTTEHAGWASSMRQSAPTSHAEI